jgi:small subunit ribosomal protein S1
MSWGRVGHPSELFKVNDEIDVIVLKYDPATERVSLGHKQLITDPWANVMERYPVGARVSGKVVSLTDYGAFIELEAGVEGLIHVSEMSWSKRVKHPSKILNVGDTVDAMVLGVDATARRISLGLKQVETNPWHDLADKYPVGSKIQGKVRNLTEFGAFVEITDGIDGLIHVSDMSWTKRVKHPSEVLKKGDVVKARITNIDVENQRVSLSIKEFMPNEWDEFARQHKIGDVLSGRIVNVTDFGLFIDIYNGLEGLAHISEIDVPSGVKLEDRFAVGDYVRTRILRIEEDEKKVGLSMRGVTQPTPNEISEMKAEAAARRHSLAASSAVGASSAGGAEAEHQRLPAPAAAEAQEPAAGAEASPEPVAAAAAAPAATAAPADAGRGKRRDSKKQQREEQAGSSE